MSSCRKLAYRHLKLITNHNLSMKSRILPLCLVVTTNYYLFLLTFRLHSFVQIQWRNWANNSFWRSSRSPPRLSVSIRYTRTIFPTPTVTVRTSPRFPHKISNQSLQVSMLTFGTIYIALPRVTCLHISVSCTNPQTDRKTDGHSQKHNFLLCRYKWCSCARKKMLPVRGESYCV